MHSHFVELPAPSTRPAESLLTADHKLQVQRASMPARPRESSPGRIQRGFGEPPPIFARDPQHTPRAASLDTTQALPDTIPGLVPPSFWSYIATTGLGLDNLNLAQLLILAWSNKPVAICQRLLWGVPALGYRKSWPSCCFWRLLHSCSPRWTAVWVCYTML